MLLFVCSTFTVYAVWWIGHFLVANKTRWRQLAFGWFTGSFVWISGMKIKVVGTPPKPPFFLVCNHLSYADVAALAVTAKGVFVAKKEVSGWFVAGRVTRDYGTIYIDRGNRRDIPRAGNLIVERLDAGEGVIVFPEGTATKGEEILPFNSSFLQFAAERDLPVSYAALSYRTPDGGPPACDYVCWWEDISFVGHMWRLFTLPEYTAVITFGEEPITSHDRKALAAELRQRVSDKFTPVL
jgi:1-acyl-sn-glycerol-3-phosphate acyltransferase